MRSLKEINGNKDNTYVAPQYSWDATKGKCELSGHYAIWQDDEDDCRWILGFETVDGNGVVLSNHETRISALAMLRSKLPVIKIHDEVRSFDFAHSADYFAVGIVRDIVEMAGCQRYKIELFGIVAGGKQSEHVPSDPFVYPPVNGTVSIFGDVCAGVVCK